MIWGVLRTKGHAPYLRDILENALTHLDGVVLVDNNESPKHRTDHPRVRYHHDPRKVAAVHSTEQFTFFRDRDHNSPNSLAGFYRDAFSLAPKGAWQVKLDDDDAWSDSGWVRLKTAIKNTPKNGIIFFSGLNWLGGENLSAERPICGGRDHFALGPELSCSWKNGELWEELHTPFLITKKYIGLTYLHLKFFGKSIGYQRDYTATNANQIADLNSKMQRTKAWHEIKRPLRYRMLALVHWRFLPNQFLGVEKLNHFWEETAHIRERLTAGLEQKL